MAKRLYRSSESRVIGGVCGGIGEYFEADPVWFRLAFVLMVFASGLGIVAYLIAWIVIPKRSGVPVPPSAEPYPTETATFAPAPHKRRPEWSSGAMAGVVLIALGLVFFFRHLFFWFDFDYIWPLLLIGIGVALIYRAVAPEPADDSAAATVPRSPEVDNGGR